MRVNRVKKTLKEGGTVIGTLVSIPDPAIVEIIAYAGFDFVIIDMEHSPIDFKDARNMIAAADAAGITPMVRVGTNDANLILHALDSGAMGIMMPHVINKAEALAFVNACRYPPSGIRGVNGAARAAGYGHSNFVEHARLSNEEILTIALIEDVEAVQIIEEIAAVDGLDVISPGPGDLSASMGLIGQMLDPRVQAAVSRVTSAVNERGKSVIGYYIAEPSQIKRCQELRARFVMFSQDSRILHSAYRNALQAMR